MFNEFISSFLFAWSQMPRWLFFNKFDWIKCLGFILKKRGVNKFRLIYESGHYCFRRGNCVRKKLIDRGTN